MKTTLALLSIQLFIFNTILSQNLEVEGSAKITQMDPATSNAQAVMQEMDGTLTVASMSSSPTYAVGDIAQGGIIFWLSSDGSMGKVLYPFEIYQEQWSNIYDIEIGVKAQSSTNGALNTHSIINQSGHITSMAKMCRDLQYGGYSDWYMPAIDELVEIFESNSLIKPSLKSLNGDLLSGTTTVISSSTEFSRTDVKRIQILNSGTTISIGQHLKIASAFPTRAIRTFFVN